MIEYNVVQHVVSTIRKLGRERVRVNNFSAKNLSQPVYSLVNELSRQSSIHNIRFEISEKIRKHIETAGIEEIYKTLTTL